MLKKLIYHEINASKRIILPMYILLVVMTIVNCLTGMIETESVLINIIPVFLLVLYFILLAVVLLGSQPIEQFVFASFSHSSTIVFMLSLVVTEYRFSGQ